VDWFLEGRDPSMLPDLRRQIAAYLRRHADAGSEIDGALLATHELIANAIEHADSPIWVSLTWSDVEPVLEVWDLGPGFTIPEGTPRTAPDREMLDGSASGAMPDPEAEGGRGLFLIAQLSSAFDAQVRAGGGARATARLPVSRSRRAECDRGRPSPPGTVGAALPHPSEAAADGSFSRESFLRALVVHLARGIEYADGPEAGSAAVEHVGLTVGGQMEAAYRTAEAIAGRLTPAQLADCMVRLKRGLGGGFEVLEITEDRIVLLNTRCPFGEVVRAAPTLCRMTSSVFGGIAARNHPGGASVMLEERIAVGDPGCRVTVYLGEPPPSVEPYTDRYDVSD